ncbi:Iterative polyketide synthase CazM 1 [Colletotrichum chlorophyti]|uniref:Iterative polyketide synthase CazM 1 n=1 Tax=Colletotrichum chlorophyti TaxID=708187 RepID=A0A1Q8S5S9_9PEZI|nr:Iterative polyketide synthase CazM 1 [Colletotrichum chlorophyti]
MSTTAVSQAEVVTLSYNILEDRSAASNEHPFAVPLPAVTKAFKETKQDTDRIVAEAGFAGYYHNVHERQKDLIVLLVIKAFQKLRCDIGRTKPGQKLRQVKSVPNAQKQLDFCFEMLVDAGVIRREGDHWVRTETPLPCGEPKEALHQILQDFPAYNSLNKLVALAGNNIAEIYAGRTDGVRSIFGSPEGRQYLEDIYGAAHPSKAFHKLMEDLMARFTQAIDVPHGSCLKILELGAGTGGTTKWLAPLLARSGVAAEYTFTDLAHGFIAQAARKFHEYPFMTFRTHDIEKPPPADLLGTQHIVIAVNAVHATPDMVKSLRNTRQFLRSDGFALVMEVQERLCWADFVFGLFEGWWLFKDGRKHATADALVWKDAFRAAGFGHVDWTDGNMRDSRLQRVFLATAMDGQ